MTTLVLSGGSTKAPLHVGAFQALEEHGYKFNTIYGNSAGSIIASCIAIGYDYDALYKLILKTDFSRLTYNSFIDKIYTGYKKFALCPDDRILELYKEVFKDIKFKDLSVDLHLMGHEIKERTYTDFCKENTPDVYLYQAVRASSSVPLLFPPFQIGDKTYIDGGISKDFPVDLVKSDYYIGHLIQSPSSGDYSNILMYGLSMIDQIIQANVENSIRSANKNGKVIRTEFHLPITKFDITLADKINMMEIGYKSVKEQL